MADSEQADAPPNVATQQSLGQLLRTTRLAHDLTLEQLAAELRIEAKQLHALEEDRFEQIGVPVFIKGYIKQYGARLGLSVPDLLILYYQQSKLGEVQIQPSRTIKLHDERQITSWVLAAIILLAAIVALAVWWWSGGSFPGAQAPSSAPRPAPASTAAPPAPAAPREPGAAPVAPPSEGAAGGAAVVEQPPAESTPAAQDGVAVAGEPQPPPAQNVAGADSPRVVDAAVAANERAAPVVAIPLEFTFDAESWTEVTDARGERLLFGLNPAGRRVTVRGEPPFAVVLGNAAAVHLVVDGAPFDIPTTGRAGELARFSVDIAEE
jgi:cytoskeleton protein RodZ